MITFLNNVHHVHQGRQEMFRGRMVPCFEVAARVDHVLERVLLRGLGPVESPGALEARELETIHAPLYLDFLRNAWNDWVAMDASNATRDALPSVWPNHGLRSDDFLHVGEDIARAGLPTVFVFEGGYAVNALGTNAVNVLEGFEQRAG